MGGSEARRDSDSEDGPFVHGTSPFSLIDTESDQWAAADKATAGKQQVNLLYHLGRWKEDAG
jgi:hypothetical protein